MKNGKCCTPNGKPIILTLMLKDEKNEKIALAYRENLKRIGITLRIQKYDATQYENRVLDSNFDMIIHQWSNSLSPGSEQVYFFGQKTAHIKGSSNYIGIQDPVAEELAKCVANAMTVESLRTATHALDRYVMHLSYQIPLSFDNKLRFAYWKDRIEFPPLNPDHDMNIMTRGWSKMDAQK
jgi:microcin C transport system substrate-binding protein